DPSIALLQEKPMGPCSYAFNILALQGEAKLPSSIPDGSSNTIAFVERYHYCGKNGARFVYWIASAPFPDLIGGDSPGTRRATFADAAFGDIIPVPGGSPQRAGPRSPDSPLKFDPIP